MHRTPREVMHFFFFSSRRRHTRLQGDWSSDVCSSDLITRANQFPSASVGADIFSQQNAKTSNQFPPYQVNAGQLNLSVIWNLDFWGKYRRQTEAARAQMLASEWGQRAGISDRKSVV